MVGVVLLSGCCVGCGDVCAWSMGAVGAWVKGAFGYVRCLRLPGGLGDLGGAGRDVWERAGAGRARSAPFFR